MSSIYGTKNTVFLMAADCIHLDSNMAGLAHGRHDEATWMSSKSSAVFVSLEKLCQMRKNTETRS